ncbi:hypothetical protein C8J56DRAFT_354541 [Mycena floridula]|nr:hypothetical protein C8J56DRAFT_354541 [Mycena floridula]
MPSFLSKVFNRKTEDKEPSPRASNGSLLDGKFEAISPTVSPTQEKFAEVQKKEKGKGKDGFSLLNRTKSGSAVNQNSDKAPHLSLNLSGPKDESGSRALGAVFEADPEAQILVPDSLIGERRLNPLETLILVRACSQAITAHGLETLGIMHPHWYSASPDAQRRLISLFIQSLAAKSPITTLSPSSSSAVSAFESEISSTRSPHDVASVLRWGLRHLQLDGSSFGKDDAWYKAFSEAERSSDYPPTAFSQKLVPLLPPAHLELLKITLDLFSSLAAHAEANGISGSKLSKLLGLWLLTSTRVEEKDTWATFYARWERSGRILEHLLLALIRDHASTQRMPKRLVELVNQYPYSKTASPSEDGLLPRPRLSTRQHPALFVHIQTEVSGASPTFHPLRLIADAFKSENSGSSGEHAQMWDNVKKAGSEEDDSSPGGYPGLSRIFSDETIRFLSLIPAESTSPQPAPIFNLHLPEPGHRRSFSLGDKGSSSGTTTPLANGKTSTLPSVASSPTDAIGLDWAQFSTSGFLESVTVGTPLASTLLDKDVEVTIPRKPSKKGPVVSRGRKSLDMLPPISTAAVPKPEVPVKKVSKCMQVSMVQLDEAFVDFWSDALLDSISASWPKFIICKLKTDVPGLEVAEKRVEWLVIEQTFGKFKVEGVDTPVEPQSPSARPRPSSPRPSFKSDLSGTFATTKKRFTFFSSKSFKGVEKVNGQEKKGKSPKIGEMGEILPEEDESEEKKGSDAAHAAAAVLTGAAAGAALVVADAVKPDEEAPKPTEPTTTGTNGSAAVQEVKEEPAVSESTPSAPAVEVPTEHLTESTSLPRAEPEAAIDKVPIPTEVVEEPVEPAVEEPYAETHPELTIEPKALEPEVATLDPVVAAASVEASPLVEESVVEPLREPEQVPEPTVELEEPVVAAPYVDSSPLADESVVEPVTQPEEVNEPEPEQAPEPVSSNFSSFSNLSPLLNVSGR